MPVSHVREPVVELYQLPASVLQVLGEDQPLVTQDFGTLTPTQETKIRFQDPHIGLTQPHLLWELNQLMKDLFLSFKKDIYTIFMMYVKSSP